MNQLKQFYTTIYSIGYSSCGNFIVAGNSYGKIAVFNLTPFLEEQFRPELDQRKPIFQFKAHDTPVYSLVSTKKLVISGSVGEICAWKWSDLKRKDNKISWSVTIPQGENLTKAEVNSIVVSSKENECLLYAGCGDNIIYCFDLESLSLKFKLTGHTDYIHCVSLGNGNQECISGSEDGSVRIWDERKDGKAAHIIEPYKHEMSSRPEFGKWIGCAAFDDNDDWLVCGGAPTLCMWHLRSLAPAVPFLKPNATSNVIRFHDGMIISGGSEPCINHWSCDGELHAEVPTSALSVYDISVNPQQKSLAAAAAGSSYKIDVCVDFRYRDFSLLFS